MASSDQKPEVQLHEAVVMASTTNGVSASSQKHQAEGAHHHGPPPGPANPLAIGFAAFSAIFGLYNSGLITDIPQVAVGVSVGFGGLGQLYASIACFIQGETYPATTFVTYAGFFFAFGIMFSTPSGCVEAATAGGSNEPLDKCMGLIQLVFTICLTVAAGWFSFAIAVVGWANMMIT
ncbi:hypothetical protein BDB00DRAFT_877207 [Zychaea mexicana]|uniref:uncharacterized protein n=1 Tax=Zychaea mexicana TaxID=64656 RepID=UPI0022FEFB9D|nr:uncharacterized protein BDB00DRAFT_877207 [Zychaea mexicana]KAI9488671.1 hypothetical protein BDB00DRAFT_877207 [Zychaea mexicana]